MRNIFILFILSAFLISCEKNNSPEFSKRIIIKETFDSNSSWTLETLNSEDGSTNEISDGYLTMRIKNLVEGHYFLSSSTNDLITTEHIDRFGLIIKIEKGKFYHYSNGIMGENHGIQFSLCYSNVDIVIPTCNLIEPHDIEIPEGTKYEIIYDQGKLQFLVDDKEVNSDLVKAVVGGSLYCNHININVECTRAPDLSKEIEFIFDEIEFYTW